MASKETMDETRQSSQHFLELIKRSHRGKFKIYIGMSAGVGKTYRMLQEAHQLLEVGVDVKIGYIETHGRAGTEALVEGLPLVPRRRLFYKGKELEDGEYRIRVPEFNHFCSTKGVSARYARKHLYESGMLRSSTDNGKINYTCPVQATDTKKTERCVCIIPKN